MRKLCHVLCLLALGCSTSGKSNESGPPQTGRAGSWPAAAPAQAAPDRAPNPVLDHAPEKAETAAVGPVQPAQPAAPGDADVCSATCERVAACHVATKELCLPACRRQMAQLTAEQGTQMSAVIATMPCEDLPDFGAQEGNCTGAEAPPAGRETHTADADGDGDGQDS